MIDLFKKTVKNLGAMRVMLVTLALILILLTPFVDTSLRPHGWNIIFSMIVPAASPLVFMVLMLDLMMCQIWKGEFTEEEGQRFVFISKVDLIVGVLVLITWLVLFF